MNCEICVTKCKGKQEKKQCIEEYLSKGKRSIPTNQ